MRSPGWGVPALGDGGDRLTTDSVQVPTKSAMTEARAAGGGSSETGGKPVSVGNLNAVLGGGSPPHRRDF